MSNSATIAYFGKDIVARAISEYFITNGITESNRDKLLASVKTNEEFLFDIVSDYVCEEKSKRGEVTPVKAI